MQVTKRLKTGNGSSKQQHIEPPGKRLLIPQTLAARKFIPGGIFVSHSEN